MTGRVRAYLGASLDGRIAGEDDDLDWLMAEPGRRAATPVPVGPDPSLEFEEFMAGVGAMLMGRRTYDVVTGSGEWHYGDTPVLVATNRPVAAERASVRPARGDAHELVGLARDVAGDRDVYVDGGSLVRSVLTAGLLDELVLTIVPTAVGGGIGLFDGLSDVVHWDVVRLATYADRMVQVTLVPHP